MDLNIVAVPPPSAAATTKDPAKGGRKKKKNNKFERRRRKAQLALQQKQKQKQQQQKHKQISPQVPHPTATTTGGNNNNNNSNNSSLEDRAGSDTSDGSESENDEGAAKLTTAREKEAGSSADRGKEEETASNSSSSSSDSDSDSADDGEDHDDDQEEGADQEEEEHGRNDDDDGGGKLRSSSSSFLPDDEEERAKYLSEFHARPMELDRRAGEGDGFGKTGGGHGVVTSKSFKPSRDSTHLTSGTTTWQDLQLNEKLASVLTDDLKLDRPTTIQVRSLPAFFVKKKEGDNDGSNNNSNLLIHSETGSGKTLAYLLPILQMMASADNSNSKKQKNSRQSGGTRCVVLCPTRELALQTHATAQRLCSKSYNWFVPGCLYGEVSRKSEKARIRKGLSIVVATPGRFLDHLTKTESLLMSLKDKLEWLVLDEADRLLDMGLGDQVKQIVQRLRANNTSSSSSNNSNGNRGWRSVLVSATVTSQVQSLAEETLSSSASSSSSSARKGGRKRSATTAANWTWIKGGKDGGDDGGAEMQRGNKSCSSDEDDEHDKEQQHHGGGNKDSAATTTTSMSSFAESTPRQLSQYHMTVSAKLRLSALIAFLAHRVARKKERVVVFMSTCASVDYYGALFESADPIVGNSNGNNDDENSSGLFGNSCRMYKLHGNIPHGERHLTLKRFAKNNNSSDRSNNKNENESSALPNRTGGAILFATDVAARGLNLPDVDWVVQYDPPCEIADYVHRAGRVARAGKAGHSLLFLLPSERPLLDVLKKRGVQNLKALSLTSTLNTAAKICHDVTADGVRRSGHGTGGGGGSNHHHHQQNSSRSGESFSSEVQRRLEEHVTADGIEAKKASLQKKRLMRKGKSRSNAEDQVSSSAVAAGQQHGDLLELARLAFLAHIRAYPTKEKLIRTIFVAKSLHLGHVARSFALKEPPKKLVKNTIRSKGSGGGGSTDFNTKKRNNSAMSFKPFEGGGQVDDDDMVEECLDNNKRKKPRNAKALLMANAAKLQQNGLDNF